MSIHFAVVFTSLYVLLSSNVDLPAFAPEMTTTEVKKANVLLLGGGAVGTIAALNIESGGLGSVTAVLRSNFKVVEEEGYVIESVDHGKLKGWRPTRG